MLIIVNPAIVTGKFVLYLALNDMRPAIKVLDSLLFRNTRAISNSFHVNNAFTTITVIIAGLDIGNSILSMTLKSSM